MDPARLFEGRPPRKHQPVDPDDIAALSEVEGARLARLVVGGRKKKPKMGDCYEAAARYVLGPLLEGRPGFLVVHGEVTGTGGAVEGVQYGHAWVERGDLVIEVANGKELAVPKMLYYVAGQIHQDRVIRYTVDEVKERILRYQHWGPWEFRSSSGL